MILLITKPFSSGTPGTTAFILQPFYYHKYSSPKILAHHILQILLFKNALPINFLMNALLIFLLPAYTKTT